MTEAQIALLDFHVPCSELSSLYKPGEECCEDHCSHDYHQEWQCKICRGASVRYPFRLACRGNPNDSVPVCYVKYYPSLVDRHPDCACRGLGYVFNPDPEVLWQAVRAKGGTLRAWVDGDFVAECRLGSPMNKPMMARADTMSEALELALELAWQKEN